MAFFSFKPASEGADNIQGTSGSDVAVAVNNTLNAGDIADLGDGDDIVRSAVDASLQNNVGSVVFGTARHDFSGFTLLNVETFEIINDSTLAQGVRYDMSSSPGIQKFRITNSSNTTTIDQIPNLALIELDNYTNPGNADVNIGFSASALSGANDIVTVNINNTNIDDLDIGTANAGNPLDPNNSGIETLRVNVTGGNSIIDDIDSGANQIEFNGAGDITVNSRLDNSATTVVSTGSGDRDLTLGNNAGVTYFGSEGVDDITGGSGADNINTADGNDIINGAGGNDIINAGGGNNTVLTGSGTNFVLTFSGNDNITAQGFDDFIDSGAGTDVIDISGTMAGRTTIIAGTGSDRIEAGNQFNADGTATGDDIDFGGDFDILRVSNGLNDVQFTSAYNLEALVLSNGVVTNLSTNAQLAGITIVYFGSGSANDTLNAGTFTRDLAVSNGQEYAGQGLGGVDTVTTGSGADAFYWRGNGALTDADSLNAGAQNNALNAGSVDALYLQGDTTITAASLIRGFEYIALETTRNSIYANLVGDSGAQYNIALGDAQAPTSGSLFINASSLRADTDGAGPLVAETVNLNTTAVTAFSVIVYTGQGNDIINSGIRGDIIFTSGGNDIINAGAGNDIIDSGLGNDVVNLQAGNNQLTDEGGNNTITLGTGDDTLLLGGGNDTVVGGANLNSFDSIPGFGMGNDTLRVFGRNYSDADFSGVGGGLETLELGSRAGDIGAFAGDEVYTFTLGNEVEKTDLTTVIVNGSGATVVDASAIAGVKSGGLIFDLSAGGDDQLTATQGDDLIIAGVGAQIVDGQAGDDRLRVSGAEFDQNDTFLGGAGNDTIEMDNTSGAVLVQVNLAQVRSVENYAYVGNGDRDPLNPDVDVNILTFANAPVNSVTTDTPINIDFSALTDQDDSSILVIANDVLDADYEFNITGSSTTTLVRKENVGINNDINFVGGSGSDILELNGGDLGSTTVFNGGGGTDVIRQNGGIITDDSYRSVSNVEVLESSSGTAVNATLGSRASQSGLVLVRGSNLDDDIELDAAFSTALRIELGSGNDRVDGDASVAALTVAVSDTELTALDVLIGGLSANDVLEVTADNGTGNATSVTGFETINVLGDGDAGVMTGSTLVVDTAAGDVSGGIQTIETFGFGSSDVFRLGGDTASARLFVNSGDGDDVIRTGSGDDRIDAGDGDNQVQSGAGNDRVTTGSGDDLIVTNAGDDIVFAGAGNDIVRGGMGNDELNGEDGNDLLRGDNGLDTILGGNGDDQIAGGAGADILTGGAGADIFFYKNVSDSSGTLGRDTITDFQSGVDKIDISDLLGTSTTNPGGLTSINFQGNFNNFTDAQGAVFANDGVIDAVFQTDLGILWFDTNDDGALNANDLQIFLQGTTSVTGGDVGEGAFVENGAAVTPYDAFDASFVAVPIVP